MEHRQYKYFSHYRTAFKNHYLDCSSFQTIFTLRAFDIIWVLTGGGPVVQPKLSAS